MKNSFLVVDEKDRIIGHKKWGELGPKDITRVSALWITNPKGEILLTKRVKTKRHDLGKWQCAVAGTVEKGETYRQNIIKETAEEIGLKGIKPEEGPKMRMSTSHEFFVQWHFLEADRPASFFRLQKSEVAGIKWFSRKELLEKIKSGRNEFTKGMPKYLKTILRHKFIKQ